jgi:hypothetical protein
MPLLEWTPAATQGLASCESNRRIAEMITRSFASSPTTPSVVIVGNGVIVTCAWEAVTNTVRVESVRKTIGARA